MKKITSVKMVEPTNWKLQQRAHNLGLTILGPYPDVDEDEGGYMIGIINKKDSTINIVDGVGCIEESDHHIYYDLSIHDLKQIIKQCEDVTKDGVLKDMIEQCKCTDITIDEIAPIIWKEMLKKVEKSRNKKAA